MALQDELSTTYTRALAAGLDEAQATLLTFNRVMLPTMRQRVAAAGGDDADPAAISGILDELDSAWRTAAGSGLAPHFFAAVLEDTYPVVFKLWSK